MFCPTCGKSVGSQHRFCSHCGAEIDAGAVGAFRTAAAQPAPPVTEMNGVPLDVYAGFWRRTIAILVDIVCIILAIVALALGVASVGKISSEDARALGQLLGWFGGLLYFESSALQATPGKLLLGIKVTDLEGNRIGFWHSIGRNVSRVFSALPIYIGYLAVVFSKRKQAFHDMIARTLVVKSKASQAEIAAAAGQAGNAGSAVLPIVASVGAVVLIGILAAIAIPAYQNYTIRAQVVEGLSLASPFKGAVSEAMAQGWKPTDISIRTLQGIRAASGKYVSEVTVGSGAVIIKYGNAANARLTGKTLVLYPGANGDDVVWICGRAAIPNDVNPAIKDGGSYTTVPDAYLPTSCHR